MAKLPYDASIINEALWRHKALPEKAEEFRDPDARRDLFVDPRMTNKLQNNKNEVIFGRRGSGKTHLFRYLVETASMSNPAGQRVLAFGFAAHEFKASAEPDLTLPFPKSVAFPYFENFISSLVQKFSDLVLTILETPDHLDVLTRLDQTGVTEVQTKVLELMDLAKRPSNRSSPVAEAVNPEDTTSISAGETSGSAARIRETEARLVSRAYSIRQRLVDIVKALRVDWVMICIDEWMSLDDGANTGIQAEFADLLKQSLFGSDRISVKIASNWYQTQFIYDADRPRGLDVGADFGAVGSLLTGRY